MKYPVVIIDDDKGVRDGIKTLLDVYDYPVLSFETAYQFLEWFTGSQKICILLDKNLADANGLEIISQILAKAETLVAIVMITGFGDIQIAVQAMQRGAIDFIEKPIDPERLLQSIELCHEKLKAGIATAKHTVSEQSPVALLSKREIQVLRKLAEGHPNKVVAYELGISMRTVEVHRARIMDKTGAKSFAELIRMAVAAKVI